MKDLTKKQSQPSWRFWLPLALQTSLIIAVPIQAVYTYTTGKTVILKTIPQDPYDLLRGYSQALTYQISDLQNLEKLSGWEDVQKEAPLKPGDRLYIVVQAPSSQLTTNPPPPWNPVAISRRLPENLPNNQIALQGRYNYNQVEYGAETYYLAESERDKINAKINQSQRTATEKNPFVVEVKVDSKGFAVPVSLWIGNENFKF